jgi:hypothetical protein
MPGWIASSSLNLGSAISFSPFWRRAVEKSSITRKPVIGLDVCNQRVSRSTGTSLYGSRIWSFGSMGRESHPTMVHSFFLDFRDHLLQGGSAVAIPYTRPLLVPAQLAASAIRSPLEISIRAAPTRIRLQRTEPRSSPTGRINCQDHRTTSRTRSAGKNSRRKETKRSSVRSLSAGSLPPIRSRLERAARPG